MNGQFGLHDSINNEITNLANQLVRIGRLQSFQYQQFVQSFQNYIPQIAQTLINAVANSPDPNNVPIELLQNVVAQYGQTMMGQIPQNPMAQPMQQPMQTNAFGYGGYQQPMMNSPMPPRPINYGGYQQPNVPSPINPFSSKNEVSQIPSQVVPQPQSRVIIQPVVHELPKAAVRTSTGVLELAKSASPQILLTTLEDKEATKLSMSTRLGAIHDVIIRSHITDDKGNAYTYSKSKLYISEPNVRRVINNFVRTSPKLCIGNWIAYLNYSCFELRNIRSKGSSTIDLSSLANNNNDVSIDSIIGDVIKSINDRDYGIVKCIGDIIVRKFNDYSEKYIRTEDDINQIIKVSELNDIGTLSSMRDKYFGRLTYHANYPDTVLKCFKLAVNEVVTDITKKGYFEAEDIASDLLADPDFVIRDNGICEREMDLNDPTFIEAIKARYTAFANIGDIVVTNFIPDELEEDLTDIVLRMEHPTNVIDALVQNVWRNTCPTILMTEGDRELIVKIGQTMNGLKIMFKGKTL